MKLDIIYTIILVAVAVPWVFVGLYKERWKRKSAEYDKLVQLSIQGEQARQAIQNQLNYVESVVGGALNRPVEVMFTEQHADIITRKIVAALGGQPKGVMN